MRLVLPLLVALWLVVTSAVSPTSGIAPTVDDNLIVPGVRIGKWTLQMTIDDLLRMNGPVSAHSGLYATIGRPRAIWDYDWDSLGFSAQSYDKKKIDLLLVGHVGRSYRTDQGITPRQSKRSDILKVYGEPTAVVKAEKASSFMIYDKIGLAFRVFDSDPSLGERSATIRFIQVFRPGSAKSIWKF